MQYKIIIITSGFFNIINLEVAFVIYTYMYVQILPDEMLLKSWGAEVHFENPFYLHIGYSCTVVKATENYNIFLTNLMLIICINITFHRL